MCAHSSQQQLVLEGTASTPHLPGGSPGKCIQVIFLFYLTTLEVHCAAAAVQQSGKGGDGLSGPACHHAFRSWRSRELPDGLHASGQAAHHQWTDAPRTHAPPGKTITNITKGFNWQDVTQSDQWWKCHDACDACQSTEGHVPDLRGLVHDMMVFCFLKLNHSGCHLFSRQGLLKMISSHIESLGWTLMQH